MDPVDVWRDKSQLMCDFGVVEMFDSWGHEAQLRQGSAGLARDCCGRKRCAYSRIRHTHGS